MLAAAVTTCVIVAAVGTVAWRSVSSMLSVFASPDCTEHDRRLVERLAADPVLTQVRPGLTRTSERHAAPCERDSETSGIATATVDADSSVTQDAVVAHYRGLLEDGGWNVAADRGRPLLCADRRIDDQQVLFALHGRVGSPQYELEIVFLPDRHDLSCE